MSKAITDIVREKYAAVAASDLSTENAGVKAVAEAFGYSAEELASVPAESNMGLSCGNPTAMANIRPGEVVVDLGSGGGLDVFLAAKKVGPTGRAIGIDMTPEMVERARVNAQKQRLSNVEFHLSTIDKLPFPDASIDCVISNCVVNLAPDKAAVFKEIFRILKPRGRVAISDLALKKPLPPEVGQDLMAYVGCIAGAVPIAEYVEALNAAGFMAVKVIDTKKDLNAYAQVEGQAGCCPPAMDGPACCSPNRPEELVTIHRGLADLLRRYDVNEYAASVQVYAVKGP